MTITCGIQPTGVVTMVMKVLPNCCNKCIYDSPDMYTFAFGPQAHISVNSPCPYYNQTENSAYILVNSSVYILLRNSTKSSQCFDASGKTAAPYKDIYVPTQYPLWIRIYSFQGLIQAYY